MLCYRTSRKKKCKHNVEDIFDGQLYKKHFDCEGYFHGTSLPAREKEIHLSLMVNTDGVSIFRSSNFGLWPVYFVINELPPEKRYIMVKLFIIIYCNKHCYLNIVGYKARFFCSCNVIMFTGWT